MGGQACVFYGAAEFSRDCDIVLLAEDDNFTRLACALEELKADCIAVPPLNWEYLSRGHAIHFRCQHPDALNIRLDVMTKMRGCDDFASLWEWRLTLEDSAGFVYEILGIEDLVKAKKTQCDKDWPMIRRLVDSHDDAHKDEATGNQVRFWLRESRTPEILITLAAQYPEHLEELLDQRRLLDETLHASKTRLRQELQQEETAEKEADEAYWRPLKKELEALRFARRKE